MYYIIYLKSKQVNYVFCFLQQKADHHSVESSIYEGLFELFPDYYTSEGLTVSDSGKLQVLSDLLASIRHVSPSDRYVYNKPEQKNKNDTDIYPYMSIRICNLQFVTLISFIGAKMMLLFLFYILLKIVCTIKKISS